MARSRSPSPLPNGDFIMAGNARPYKGGGLARQTRAALPRDARGASSAAQKAFQLPPSMSCRGGVEPPSDRGERIGQAEQASARSASGGEEKRKKKTGGQFSPAFGLVTAKRVSELVPDPPCLENVTGNNGRALRAVAKVLFVMCGGVAGAAFFVGSIALGKLFGKPHRTALRWLSQLESQGVIRRTWTGGKCRRDEDGNEYAAGALVNRASEYEFGGLPKIGGAV